MEITDIRRISKQGYPCLALKIDGKPALLIPEIKPTLYEKKIVFVGGNGEGWEESLPPIEIEVDGSRSKRILKGFSDDPELWKIYDDFLSSLEDGTFQPDEIIDPPNI